jgi:hypothetical protein
MGQAVSDRPLLRDVDPDALRITRDDQFAQRLPLRVQVAA